MKILFITPNPLGDTVLSTGLLAHLSKIYPRADFTIATGPLGMSLFEGFPGLENLISLKKQKHHLHWGALWKQTVWRRWDIIVDMRNSAVSRLILAKKKYIKSSKKFDFEDHVVVQNAKIMGLGEHPPAPRISLSADQKSRALNLVPDTGHKILAVGPTANFIGKMWPAENFTELLRRTVRPGGIFENHQVAIFGAPDERDRAAPVIEALPADKVIDLVGATDPGTGAACLDRCNFYVGNDSGLMHVAAALGVPTLGLFGPSRDQNYAPWGDHCSHIRTPESRDELIGHANFEPRKVQDSLMKNLTVDQVEEEIQALFKNKS